MKFRMFTDRDGGKVADVICGEEKIPNLLVVSEDFHMMISRLNTIAE